MNRIVLNEKGIYIDGEYRVLLASSLFYFRIPREKWDSRMRLLKTAGYNTIDVYFPWNYHETAPGVWDFTGDRDVEAFLKLAAAHELYVIARPGPYICSEWDGGAIPAWLAADEVEVRQDNPEFLRLIGGWYEHILPLVAPFQITHGGSVICMQIENELDFFNCKSPVSYMEKLMHKSDALDIEVPLFYCCGQNDLLRGGGLTPGLYTAYNVYADASQSGLEERALHLYASVQERHMPFLVTETNREHSFLKRLFACGAKLLSPYNQTAGATLDWYNGLTNWGSDEAPLSLMATDYDFDSMIGSAGEVNSEFYQARLLAGLLYSLPQEFGQALPCIAQNIYVVSENASSSVLPLLKTERGDFLAVSNLGEEIVAALHTPDGILSLAMPKMYTKLLPLSLVLSISEETVLCASNYELAYLTEADGQIMAGLYGDGIFQAVISVQGKKEWVTCTPDKDMEYITIGNVMLVIASTPVMAYSHIPGLPDMARNLDTQVSGQTLTSLTTADYTLCPSASREVPVLPMEKLQQYRGIGCYSIKLPEDSDILLHNVSDILTVIQGGDTLETVYTRGGCLERHWSKGNYDIFTEIWGHSNFDDVRCKSLRVNSLKGVTDIVTVTERTDVSDNWLFDLDEQPLEEWYFFRHSGFNTIMGIDSYNRAVTPLRTVYDKWITISEEADCLFLHFSEADCLISVYVNGHYEGIVIKDDPYINISSYAGSSRIQLTLRIDRRYFSDKAGKVTLLTGKKLQSCFYSSIPVESIAMPDTHAVSSLPLKLTSGSNILFTIPLGHDSGKDIKLFFTGQDVKLTVIWNHRIVGRLVLNTESFPIVKGGRDNVLYLCHEWLAKGAVVIWCQAIGAHPMIESITEYRYVNVTD